MNETEAIGCFKAMVVNTQVGQVALDSCLMEYMRCLTRLEHVKDYATLTKVSHQPNFHINPLVFYVGGHF